VFKWSNKNYGGRQSYRQGVAITGRNRTGPPCSVDRLTVHAPGGRRDRPPAALQTTTDNNDRHQPAKQYWLIRPASSKAIDIVTVRLEVADTVKVEFSSS